MISMKNNYYDTLLSILFVLIDRRMGWSEITFRASQLGIYVFRSFLQVSASSLQSPWRCAVYTSVLGEEVSRYTSIYT